MDYLYTDGTNEILIETIQDETRRKVIEKYIKCRKDNKLTQAELAESAGIPRTNITRFESGNYNPSLEMMVRIAFALGMKIEIDLQKVETGLL